MLWRLFYLCLDDSLGAVCLYENECVVCALTVWQKDWLMGKPSVSIIEDAQQGPPLWTLPGYVISIAVMESICFPLVFPLSHALLSPQTFASIKWGKATVWTKDESHLIILMINGSAFCDFSVWCHGETELCHWALFVLSEVTQLRCPSQKKLLQFVHCNVGEWMKTKYRNNIEDKPLLLVLNNVMKHKCNHLKNELSKISTVYVAKI